MTSYVRAEAQLPDQIDLAEGAQEVTVLGAESGDGFLGNGAIVLADINGDGIDDLILGAVTADGPDDSRSNAGEVYAYWGTRQLGGVADLLGTQGATPDLTIFGGDSDDRISDYEALTTGDVNGDGIADLIVGAVLGDGLNNDRISSGAVYIFYGGPSLGGVRDVAGAVGGAPDVVIFGAAAGDRLAETGAIALADLDSDGIDDLVLGTPVSDGPAGAKSDAGAVYVVYGSSNIASVVDLAAAFEGTAIYGRQTTDRLTISGLRSVGDFNGDGIDDIVLGALAANGSMHSRENAGIAYIFFGGEERLPASIDLAFANADVTIVGAAAGDLLTGQGAVATGDLNGDGIDDVVLGALESDGRIGSRSNSGSAHVIFGSTALPNVLDLANVAADVTVYGRRLGDELTGGSAIAIADFTGDGIDDLLVGARLGGDGNLDRSNAGEVYLLAGGANIATEIDLGVDSPTTTIIGAMAGDGLSLFRNAASDFSGDGIADLVVGTWHGNGPEGDRPDAGTAYILYGSPAFPPVFDLGVQDPDVVIHGATAFDMLTSQSGGLAGSGDVNGDGIDDLVLGAPGADGPDDGRQDAGEAYVLFGAHGVRDLLDAELLALEISGALLPPEELTARISADLAAIRDENPDIPVIHHAPGWQVGMLLVQLTAEAAEAFRNGSYTGLDALNITYASVQMTANGDELTLRFSEPYNPEFLVPLYAAADGVVNAYVFGLDDAGDQIEVNDSEYVFRTPRETDVYFDYWGFEVFDGDVFELLPSDLSVPVNNLGLRECRPYSSFKILNLGELPPNWRIEGGEGLVRVEPREGSDLATVQIHSLITEFTQDRTATLRVTNIDDPDDFEDVVVRILKTADVTIGLGAGQADATNTLPITFDVVFTEAITGFGRDDVIIDGTASGVAFDVVRSGVDFLNYTVIVNSVTVDGTIEPRIPARGCDDHSGLPYFDSTSLGSLVHYTAPPPEVTINQGEEQPDPTTRLPIVFDVYFNENVVGFDEEDILFEGTAEVGDFEILGSGSQYTVEVTSVIGDGTIIASIPSGGCTSIGGKPNALSTSIDNTVTYASSGLSATVEQSAQQADPTLALPIVFDVAFSRPVTGFDADDVVLKGAARGLEFNVIGSGANYQINVTEVRGDGIIVASVEGLAAFDGFGFENSPSTSTDNRVTYNNGISPSVTVNQSGKQEDPTSRLPIEFDVTFSEAVKNFDASDVVMGGSATGVVFDVIGETGSSYTIRVVSVGFEGDLVPAVPAGVCEDLSGNPNAASTSDDNSVSYMFAPPEVSVEQGEDQEDGTGQFPILFDVVFTRDVTGFDVSDVIMGGTATDVTFDVSGSGAAYVITVPGVGGEGTLEPSVGADAAQDGAGNLSLASESEDNTVKYVNSELLITVEQSEGQADPASVFPITFDIEFSKEVFSFDARDVTMGGTATDVTFDVQGDGLLWTLNVRSAAGGGTLIPEIEAGTCRDWAGFANVASVSTDNSVTYIDATNPSVTVEQSPMQSDPAYRFPIRFDIEFNEEVEGFTASGVTMGGSASDVVFEIDGEGRYYEIFVSTVGGEGTIVPSIAAGAAQDMAGNFNNSSVSEDNSVKYAAPSPTVAVEQGEDQDDPTRNVPIFFDVSFSEAVTGFDASDVIMGGTAPGIEFEVTGEGARYVIEVTSLDGEGTVEPSVIADACVSRFGKSNIASFSRDNSVSYSPSPLEVSVEQAEGQADPTTGFPIRFDVTFSKPPKGFGKEAVDMGGTAAEVEFDVEVEGEGGDRTYTIVVSHVGGSGTVIPTVGAISVRDWAGFPNSASTSEDNVVTYIDETPPEVTIEQGEKQRDPASGLPVRFEVEFSESVEGFDADDVTLGGTATGVTLEVSGAGRKYAVSVTGVEIDGTIIATIAAGVCEDLAGNLNLASTSEDNSVTYKSPPPEVTIEQGENQNDPVNSLPIRFDVVFSSSVTGFDASDVVMEGDATGVEFSVDRDGADYVIVVTALATDGAVVPSIPEDAALSVAGLRPNFASTSEDNSVTYDTTGPDVTIEQSGAQEDPTSEVPIFFRVTFSEDVVGFDASDLTYDGTATDLTVEVIGSGANYRIEVTSVGFDGTIVPSLLEGVCEDLAGNPNRPSVSEDNSVAYVGLPPGVTIEQSPDQADPTNELSVFYDVTFTREVDGLDAAGIKLVGTVPDVELAVTGSGADYVIEVTDVGGDGTIVPVVISGTTQDLQGRRNVESTSIDNRVTMDTIGPRATLTSFTSDPTEAFPIPVTVRFSEVVVEFETSDLVVTNGTVRDLFTTDGQTYTFEFFPETQDLVTIELADDAAEDEAGNGNTGAAFSRLFNGELPGARSLDLVTDGDSVVIYGADSQDAMTFLGSTVAADINGDGIDDLILGAPYAAGPEDEREDAGELYVYFGAENFEGKKDIAGEVGPKPDLFVYGATSGDLLTVDNQIFTGDVNGDGLNDLVFSAPGATGPDESAPGAGQVYVIFGASEFPVALDIAAGDQDVTIFGKGADDGLTVLLLADLDGDGIDDLVLGTPNADGLDNNRADSGEAYILFGSPDLAEEIDLATKGDFVSIYGAAEGDGLTQGGSENRTPVAAGDVNGDGITDLLLGAALADGPNGGRENSGQVYVIFGSTLLPQTIDLALGHEDLLIHGSQGDDFSGLAGFPNFIVGDLNLDGIDDITLGSWLADGPEGSRVNGGETYVVFGNTELAGVIDLGLGQANVTIYGASEWDGSSTEGALAMGDMNGDGGQDLIVGAWYADGPQDTRKYVGEVYIIYGAETLPTSIDLAASGEDVTVFGATPNDRLAGTLVVEDVNADGIDDLAITSRGGDGPNERRDFAGEVYIIHGDAELPESIDLSAGLADFTIYGASEGDGLTVVGSGDLDHDGVNDLLLAAWPGDGPDESRTDAGEAYVLFGSRERTTPVLVTIEQGVAQEDPTGALPITFDVVFNTNVTGFDASDVVIDGTAGGFAVEVSGSGAEYTVVVTALEGPGTVIASIPHGVSEDRLENLNNASASEDNSVTYEATLAELEILISPPSVLRTTLGPVTYTVTYRNAASVGLTVDDITLGSVGTADGVVTVTDNGDRTWTVTISEVIGEGELDISIASGSATDASGDPAGAVGPSEVFEVFRDNAPPTIEVVRPGSGGELRELMIPITWDGEDTDDDARILIGYDTDNVGFDGVVLADTISEDNNPQGPLMWDLTEIPAGDYWIYAIIDDGVNPPVRDYSGGVVTVSEEVSICHLPPGQTENVQSLRIARSAIPAHLAHGDILGSCEVDEANIVFYIDHDDDGAFTEGEGIDGADAYHRGLDVGQTSSGGGIQLLDIKVGGALFAEHTIYDQPSAKPGHEVVGDTLFSVRVDSDVMLPNGDYEHVVFDGTSPRYVAMAHSVIEWNFTVAFEYTPSSKDRLWWESVFSDASDFMYDYTDGQMQFGAIHIDYGVSTLSQEWINADITVSDGEEWPRANVGGAYIQNGKIFLGRLWQGFDVSKRFKNTFSTVVAHEANHYALKIYDEYIDANGGRTANNRSRHPGKFPLNYGVMESQWNSSELSSSNDYLAGYSGASTDRTLTTYQSWRHDLANGGPAFSCWDYLQETVFGPLLSDLSPSLHLTLPEAGEFVNGVSTTEDRPGPESGQLYAPYYVEPTITTSVGKSVGVLDKVGRTVVVGISADQPLRSQIVRITAAGVSRILGMTGFDGILDGVTLIPGDTLRVYTGNTYSAVEVTVPVGRVEVVHDSSLPLRKALGDETGLGVNVVLDVESLESGITIAGDILFESDTTETPTFTISAESGATYSGDLVSSSARKYTLSADIGESDLSGTLELYATTTAGIVETIGRYEITPAEINGVPADGKLNVNISDDSASGSTIILYETEALTLPNTGASNTRVGSATSIALEILPNDGIGIQLRYSDLDVQGIDESAIEIARWSAGSSTWEPLSGQELSVEANTIGGTSNDKGLFAIFGPTTADASVPGGISDLSAATGTSNWTVVLDWTAPGDDGATGTVLVYDLRYSDVPLTDENWDDAIPYEVTVSPASAGTTETVEISMADPDTLYYFAVAAIDEAGNVGERSNGASARSFANDADGDGIPDTYERSYSLDVARADADEDKDGDGLSNLIEYNAGTSPRLADSDTDGLPDKWEIDHGLNPLLATGNDGSEGDPDGDLFTNFEEYGGNSDPIDPDSKPRQVIGCASGVENRDPSDVGADIALIVLLMSSLVFLGRKRNS